MRAFHVYVSFLFSAILSAQSLSFDLATVPTSAPPQSVVTGDFNGDGKPDLAVTGPVASKSCLAMAMALSGPPT
jgi:hypothetical protein